MAQMFPPNGPAETDSGAERRLYDLFRRQLSSDYYVIHSANWHAVDEHGRVKDGEADFVIIHPRHGILVLEVKGGGITRNGVTQQWTTVNAQGQRSPIKDPFKQAKQSMHVLVKTLRAAPQTKPFAADYRLGYGVWFPDAAWPRDGEGSFQGVDDLALDVQHLRAPEEALQQVYKHFAAKTPPTELSDEAIDALISQLTPTIEAKTSLAVEIAGEEARIHQLTQAQYERLRAMWQVQHQLAIPGAAGTGKTVLALEMAWRLAEEGLDVLYLCANPHLAGWLTYRIERDPRPNKPAFTIQSVKSLVAAIAEAGGQRLGEIGPLEMTSADNQKTLSSILSQNIRELERRGKPMPYDAVLVDEAQDVEQALWVPIQKLLRDRTDGFFYVFYDEAQRLDLPGKWTFRPAGAKTYFPLTLNCRNTQAIYEVMARYNPALLNQPFEGPPGRPIHYIEVDHSPAIAPSTSSTGSSSDREDSALQHALDAVLGSGGGLRPEDVLVITCRRETKSRWYRSDNRTIGAHTLRWLRHGEKDGHVPIAPIRSAKGLEFKVVILAEVDGLQDEPRREALLYVAISRAMYHLIVLGSPRELEGPAPSLWGEMVAATLGKQQR